MIKQTLFTSDIYKVKVKQHEVANADALEGDMIFFAPYLNHSIPVQKTEVPRITTAFNITITEN